MSINRLIPNVALLSCRQTMLAELLLAMLAIPACGIGQPSGTAESVEWSYDGPGAPEKWASLSEEYATCAQGRWQSPVDITGYEPGVLPPVGFSYHGDAAAIRNDGRAIYVDYAPGNTFSVGQHMFELESAHFHQPSEHRIDGVNFPAELHLVHVGRRGFAVVALLFEVGQPPTPWSRRSWTLPLPSTTPSPAGPPPRCPVRGHRLQRGRLGGGKSRTSQCRSPGKN